jgi:protein-tyrosine phosphatase
MKNLLFLCTGNYYRSRFAEALFNKLAEQKELQWRATSAALALERGVDNVGAISPHALEALQRLGITAEERMPRAVTMEDLRDADLIVALDDNEHRPLLLKRWPDVSGRVTYWRVPDVGLMEALEALGEIEQQVEGLVRQLSNRPGGRNLYPLSA